MPLAWALRSPPESGMWMMRGDMALYKLSAIPSFRKPLELGAVCAQTAKYYKIGATITDDR